MCEVSSTTTPPLPDAIMNYNELDTQPNQTGQEANEPETQVQQQNNEECKMNDQRDKLRKMLIRKDSAIERMSIQLQNLEAQLKSAVNSKLDVIARLEKIEGKEQALFFKERQMNSEMKHLNNNIKCLTENLNKNIVELTNTRGELLSASAQFEIDIKHKSEQLRLANLKIFELDQMNEMLKKENENYSDKLLQQFTESGKLLQIYDDSLKTQTKLAELYKGNSDDYQAQVEKLAAGSDEMRRLLYEIADESEKFETELKQAELDRQIELDAMNEVKIKLKRELKHANSLLRAYHSNDGDGIENDGEVGMEIVNNLPLTFTELYSQYRSVVEQLQSKDREYDILELEMKTLIQDSKEKAFESKEQQSELKRQKEANEKLIEERTSFRVGNVVGREELKSCQSQCELLKIENDNLKCFGYEYLKKSLDGPPVVKLDFSTAEGKSNSVDLKDQNQKLMVIVRDLMARLHGIETNNVGESADQNDEIKNAVVTSSAHHKSVQVEEGDLIIEGGMHNSRVIENVTPPKEKQNLLQVDEITEDNRQLINKIGELNAEKDLLLAERSFFDVRMNQRNEQNNSLDQQNQKYMAVISELNVANKYLKDENANGSLKLYAAESGLAHLLNQHRSLSDIKDSLVVEVETLKQELIQEKVSNKTLKYELETMKAAAERMKIELKMRIENADGHFFLQRSRLQTEIVRCEQMPSKVLTDEAIQTDEVIENPAQNSAEILQSNEMVDDYDVSRAMKNDFLHSLQLTESTPQSNSSTIADSRKRKEQNDEVASSSTEGPFKRTRSNKKPCVSFIDLSEDSDEEGDIDVCNVDPNLQNIQLQLLSEVRTRKQTKFINDAFNGTDPVSSINLRPATSNDEKVPNRKSTSRFVHERGRSSNRCRSSGRARSGTVKTTSRSPSSTAGRSKKNRSFSDERSPVIIETSTSNRSINHVPPFADSVNPDYADRQPATADHLRINKRRSGRLISRSHHHNTK